ncbi:helix-turn-helix domain-containing protein [Actinomadura kijaniata]|uniref:helix-turn-helix domain-containing protein n=1 Tax=Actinomadura kijaniata TaxID=46161 RepID=UPI00082FD154|nr:helix-turn-helix domain-containing protein [Actinomadura kijaniata]
MNDGAAGSDVVEHGTLTGYKIRLCRCPACTAANRRYVNRRTRLIAYGRWQPYVDAAPVRAHVRQLMQAGLGWRRIAALAGVSNGALCKLLYGDRRTGRLPSRKLRPDTAAALLAVRADLDTLAPGARIDAAGTRRRIQALAALGWSVCEQARRLDRSVSNYSTLMRRQYVTVATARQVRALYEQLSMVVPDPAGRNGVARARAEAARKGWVPPLAWDEDLIDLPEADLQQELARRAAVMDDDQAAACHNARYKLGDLSPLVVAGAREYKRRRHQAARTTNRTTNRTTVAPRVA